MKECTTNGKKYRLPNVLSEFQLEMYMHLINWKWKNITKEPGYYKYTRQGKVHKIAYDAIIPDQYHDSHYPLYPEIVDRFFEHQKNFPFKSHKFLGHMASSQAACANLFLPILKDPKTAAEILRSVKEDLASIATDQLDQGFRIEFWDEGHNSLNDHNRATGTDSDIAIAYRDKDNNLNLWLIEHKLTEQEFTACGAAKSSNRTSAHKCRPTSAILNNPELCYYHSGCGYAYWNITKGNPYIFPVDNLLKYEWCPFKSGLNQLWRNQLLAIAVENSEMPDLPYKKVFFSVVFHPENQSLLASIQNYEQLIDHNDRFSFFTSDRIIGASREVNIPETNEWVEWYKELYYF